MIFLKKLSKDKIFFPVDSRKDSVTVRDGIPVKPLVQAKLKCGGFFISLLNELNEVFAA